MAHPSLRVCVTFLMIILCACQLSEDRRFESERLRLAAGINADLISLRVCETLPECQKRQLFFLSPRAGGLSLQLWGVKDGEVLKKILGRSATFFINETRLKIVSVEVYSITKLESLAVPAWDSVTPVEELTFKRE